MDTYGLEVIGDAIKEMARDFAEAMAVVEEFAREDEDVYLNGYGSEPGSGSRGAGERAGAGRGGGQGRGRGRGGSSRGGVPANLGRRFMEEVEGKTGVVGVLHVCWARSV